MLYLDAKLMFLCGSNNQALITSLNQNISLNSFKLLVVWDLWMWCPKWWLKVETLILSSLLSHKYNLYNSPVEIWRFLLDHGLDVSSSHFDKPWPLTAALEDKNVEIAKLLVQNDAKIDHRIYCWQLKWRETNQSWWRWWYSLTEGGSSYCMVLSIIGIIQSMSNFKF